MPNTLSLYTIHTHHGSSSRHTAFTTTVVGRPPPQRDDTGTVKASILERRQAVQ